MRTCIAKLLQSMYVIFQIAIRPYVERPYGSLMVDKQNPDRVRGRGSNIGHLVGGTGFEPVTLWV